MNNMKLFNVNFTNNTLNTYMRIMKPCINDKNIVDRNFLNEMFESLIDANEYVDIALFVRDIKYKTKENKELLNIKSLNSNFLPELIKNYIIENNYLLIEYKSIINDKNIIINFYIYYDNINDIYENINNNFNSIFNIFKNKIENNIELNKKEIKSYKNLLKIYDYYAKIILMWIHIINKYSKKKCGRNLKINIYHTYFDKQLPFNQNEIFGPIHANSAFTTNCSENSEIIIFRKEEWFKVFIHETMHNFDLDFSLMNQNNFNKNIKKMFEINSRMNIFEGYCDFWARIVLSCFNSFIFLTNDVKKKVEKINKPNKSEGQINKAESQIIEKKDFYKLCDLFIEIERIFTIYQANKVLRYMGLKYIDFINNSDINSNYNKDKLILFKENTNIFSYYIITAILFVEYNMFIGWCQTNNKLLFKFENTEKHLKLFEKYINNIYDNKFVLNAFSCVDMMLEHMIYKFDKDILNFLELNKKNKSKKIDKTSKQKKQYKNSIIINNLINTMRMSFIELV